VQQRDPVMIANSVATRGTPAMAPTLTQVAVQQAKGVARSDLLTQGDIVPVAERRSRLVGPPPTFEVNLLQHMRETRYDPPDTAEPAPEMPDPAMPDLPPEQTKTPPDLYRQLDQSRADPPADGVDTRL
jgi:hypothetical protein